MLNPIVVILSGYLKYFRNRIHFSLEQGHLTEFHIKQREASSVYNLDGYVVMARYRASTGQQWPSVEPVLKAC